MAPTDQPALAAIAALNEPLRRRVYEFVVASPTPVGRDETAAALDVARSVAAFHLDKLAEVGLLEVEFRRPGGGGGPGAGRPPKLYRRSAREVSLSFPQRRYELAGQLLADGVARSDATGMPAAEGVRQAARSYGTEIGRSQRALRRPAAVVLDAVARALAAEGYEPYREDDGLALANCPFHALAEEQRELVCSMNLELVTGLLEGMSAPRVEACLDPGAARCCVRVRRAT